eukprot:COSAG06_NODE_23207_length_699_cov_1.868333_1_plen_126_part_00
MLPVCRAVCDAARHLHVWCVCGVLVGAFRVETKIDEAVAVTMSFAGSDNILVLPDNGVCAAPRSLAVARASLRAATTRQSSQADVARRGAAAAAAGNGQLTATRTIPAHAEKTLICSVRQVRHGL